MRTRGGDGRPAAPWSGPPASRAGKRGVCLRPLERCQPRTLTNTDRGAALPGGARPAPLHAAQQQRGRDNTRASRQAQTWKAQGVVPRQTCFCIWKGERGEGVMLAAHLCMAHSSAWPTPFHAPGILRDQARGYLLREACPAFPGPWTGLCLLNGAESRDCLSSQTTGFRRPAGAGVSPKLSPSPQCSPRFPALPSPSTMATRRQVTRGLPSRHPCGQVACFTGHRDVHTCVTHLKPSAPRFLL